MMFTEGCFFPYFDFTCDDGKKKMYSYRNRHELKAKMKHSFTEFSNQKRNLNISMVQCLSWTIRSHEQKEQNYIKRKERLLLSMPTRNYTFTQSLMASCTDENYLRFEFCVWKPILLVFNCRQLMHTFIAGVFCCCLLWAKNKLVCFPLRFE